MQHVQFVKVRHQELVKSMKKVLAQIDTKVPELSMGAV